MKHFMFTKHNVLLLQKLYLPLVFIFCICQTSVAQPGPVESWRKVYVGNDYDHIKGWVQVSGGYIIGGQSDSQGSYDKTEDSQGGYDYWIIKIDNAGNKLWDRTFGGSFNDELSSLIATPDGGVLMGGSSNSGISGDKTQSSRGMNDYWVVKIDGSGTKQWDRRFGGLGNDNLSQIISTSDGGYLLAGTSFSGIGGDKTEAARSLSDYWVVKINSSGTKVWDKTFGGSGSSPKGFDNLVSIVASPTGGFLIAGTSNSGAGFEKSVASISTDHWLIKINSAGAKEWDRTYSFGEDQALAGILVAPDGGYIIGGSVRTPYVVGEHESELVLRKINASGVTQWQKVFNPIHKEQEVNALYISSMASTSSGFSILYYAQVPTGDDIGPMFLAKYNWDGIKQYQFQVEIAEQFWPGYINYNSAGEAMIGYVANIYGNNDTDYGIIKYKEERALAPYLHLVLEQNKSDNKLIVDAVPSHFNTEFSKVEFYANGVKLAEDSSEPFYYYWKDGPVGEHKIHAVAYPISGPPITSEVITWNTFAYMGYQIEKSFTVLSDVGSNSISKVKSPTLSSGSSVRLPDAGDMIWASFYVDPGKYYLRVRLRSGAYTSTANYPTSFWPDGYSFWIDGDPVKFTGDPSSVSEKKSTYGGSYWGTMTSPLLDMNYGRVSVSIRANKPWAGVDYIELVPVKKRLEAEYYAYIITDVGSNKITNISSEIFSSNSSKRIWDVNDEIGFYFSAYPGAYKIVARVRSGYYNATTHKPTSYWPNGYAFKLNGVNTVFTGDNSSLSAPNSIYGGSYWGTMTTSTIQLTGRDHYLSIKAIAQWGGVDYIELIPVNAATPSARLAIPEHSQNSPGVFPNPFRNNIRVELPEPLNEKAHILILDTYGNIRFKKSIYLTNSQSLSIDLSEAGLKPDLYIMKVNTSKFQKTLRVTKE